MIPHLAATFAVAFAALPARAGTAQTGAELLAAFDAMMSPPAFESRFAMTAHRDDGSERRYEMRAWKSGADRFRAAFEAPASAKGQEVLRNGDNLWIYIPSLKRATRLAARNDFMGGDFNNADVLRVNWTADYIVASDKPVGDARVLELKAKGPEVAYDRIEFTVAAGDGSPRSAVFYASSGKALREAAFGPPAVWGEGHRRPGLVTMKNLLLPARWSTMETLSFAPAKAIPDTLFSVTALGR